jgi:PAS domain S-box-containing protein
MEQVLAEWKRYLDGVPPHGHLRPVILASWQRSQLVGVDPQPREVPFRRVADDDLQQRLAGGAELIAVATPHLEWTTAFLHAVPHVVYLTDRDGIVLRSWGDRSLIDNFGLAPGYDWSERAMGTNGAGTALATNQPVAVVGPEHFLHPFHDCTCTAAPIHGPGGAVIGAIDISTGVAEGSPEQVVLAAHIAFVIDRELALREQVRRHEAVPPSWQGAGLVDNSCDAVPGTTLEDQLRQRTAELRASEQCFRLLVEGTADYAMFLLDPAGYVWSWNPGAERIKGYRTEEIIGQHCSRFYAEEDVQAGKPDQQLRVAATCGRSEDEGWRVRKDGSRFWASVITTAVRDEAGTLKGFSKITRDLTERKQSEERFRLVVEAAPTGMLLVDQNGEICLANARVGEMFGYHAGELLGKPVELLVPEPLRDQHPTDRARFLAAPAPRHLGEGSNLFGQRRDGSEFPVEIGLVPLSLEQGTFILASVLDITERKRAEQELRASEELGRSILNAITAHIAVLDEHGYIIAVNSAWERFAVANDNVNLSRSGIGTNYLEVCRQAVQEGAEQAAEILDALEGILNGSLQEYSIEYPCHSPAEKRWFMLHVTPLSSKLGGAVVAHTSITELKQAEEALRCAHDQLEQRVQERTVQLTELNESLRREVEERRVAETRLRESEERYRAVVQDQTELVSRLRADGTFLFVNDVFCRTFGKAAEELIGQRWVPVAHPDDVSAMEGQLATLSPQHPVVRVENRVFDSEGRVRWMEFVNRGFFGPGGELIEIQSVGRDVTERKQAEDAIRAALQERETLLKEVHHRVKNNLQVISSLLHMQSLHTPDRTSVELFRESQHRVRSMALVHERLYRSQDFRHVDFTSYIEHLANYLFRSYQINSDCIALACDVYEVHLPLDAAVPCGLLVNELISNCLKHAFPGRERGRILVELTPVNEAEVLLSVSDDGVGLPPSIEPEGADTFGMQLIVALVDQLHGRLEVRREAGTTMRVVFPLASVGGGKRG